MKQLNNTNAIWGQVDQPKTSNDKITYHGEYHTFEDIDMSKFTDEVLVWHTPEFSKEEWRYGLYGIKNREDSNYVKEEGVMTIELQKKYLIYSCIFFNNKYIELLDLLLKTYTIHNNSNTTFLIVCCLSLKSNIEELFNKYNIAGKIWNLNLKTKFEACYSRYFIFNYPEINKYTKILYLDCDILITNNLSNILNLNIEHKIYAIEEGNTNSSLRQPSVRNNDWGKYYFKDNNPNVSGFNSGILLFNNNSIIKSLFNTFINFTNKELTKNNYQELFKQTKEVDFDIIFGDQPILNYLAIANNLYNNITLNNKIKLNPINYTGETLAHFCGFLTNHNGVDVKKNKMINYINSLKYVYLQCHGGFNDLLCTIYNSLNYCRQYNRILLLNTNNTVYKINWFDYFDFKFSNIICCINKIKSIYKSEYSIYPNSLNNKFLDILNGTINFSNEISNSDDNMINHIVYNKFKLYLPQNSCSENIIINAQMSCDKWENKNNISIFKDLIIKPILKTYSLNNYQKLPKPYLSIHIRNTDYQCDYKNIYYENKYQIHQYKTIYIATDNKTSLDFFRQQGLNIYNFTTFPNIQSNNLHENEEISGDIKIKDLISDLYIMAMSDMLLSNSKGGFIHLAKECFNNKDLIKDKFI